MAGPSVKLSVKELGTGTISIKGLELMLGRILEEDWEEPVGPTPRPRVATLRPWDMRLLERYRPLYSPMCDMCCQCAYGKCDLSDGKKGACGIDLRTQQSRRMLLDSAIGAAAHTTHAIHLVEYLIKKRGRDSPVSLGEEVVIEAPITRVVVGMRPKTLGDLESALEYVTEGLTELLSSALPGQESSNLDFESKALHAGTLDGVAMEIADLAQISALGYPKGDPDSPLVELGMGVVDNSKPVVLFIGHNAAPGVEAVEYLEESGLYGKVELAGICCTSHDLARYRQGTKIIGPMSRQLTFVRSGIADVVVLDQECVRLDMIGEALKKDSRVITTIAQNCGGLPDLTAEPTEQIVERLVAGKDPAVLILDPVKAGEVAVKTALAIAPGRREKQYLEDALAKASKCTKCGSCRRACPHDLKVDEAVWAAKGNDPSRLADLYNFCMACGKCESACPRDLPIVSMVQEAALEAIRTSRFKVRAGRGPILDTEIRSVGRPIVMGEIPGVVAFAGCSNFPRGGHEVVEMADEFARRRFIVVASGCAAMEIGSYRDAEGLTLYEKYPGSFDAGGLVNVGSCVANSHIIGAAIKIANIFAKRNLRGNYEEIADYILNRVGAVGIVWGTFSNKAEAIGNSAVRFGIPVILGPHGAKHRRAYLGRSDRKEDWTPYDVRTGRRLYVGPAPEHLWYVAETKEEAMVMAAKLVMRPSDTTLGRQIKLTHYLDLSQRLHGTLPDDLHLFVRTETDLPILMKEQIIPILKQKGWEPTEIPQLGSTLLDRLAAGRS